MTSDELLDDLGERIDRGVEQLRRMASATHDFTERGRLDTKASGMLVVRDWLRSYRTPKNVECPCERCNPQTGIYRRFTMCPDCGNKRCPKGTDHDLTRTGSNEPGQPGSSWADYTTPGNVECQTCGRARPGWVYVRRNGWQPCPDCPTPENVEEPT